jgi:hypothetical protein
MFRIVFLATVCVSAYSQLRPDATNPRWGCYDAQPGHPTEAEKRSFVEAALPTAQDLERNGGVPAAGILAMASLESGFGFTRTAQFADNLFGWKYTTDAAADGRASWTLGCQPATDPGNKYVMFRDHNDSLSFVGRKLAQLASYKKVTAQYHADRAAALPVEEAVRRWVHGIQAAGYNPYASYPDRVLGVANDFLHPGSAVSPVNGLYKYSAALATQATTSLAAGTSARAEAEKVLTAKLQRARYMSSQSCDTAPITTWPGYEGRAVLRCRYSVTSNGKTLSAVVYLLNPSAGNLTDRIANACAAIGLGDKASCGRGLANLIVDQNGGQFPVAGFVIERKKDAGGTGPDPVYLEFRDGTTIVSGDRLNFTDRQLTIEAMEHAARAQVIATRTYARIANATREDYRRAGGTEAVGTNPATDRDNRWPTVVRANELRAQDAGLDDLLRGLAMGMRVKLSSK